MIATPNFLYPLHKGTTKNSRTKKIIELDLGHFPDNIK